MNNWKAIKRFYDAWNPTILAERKDELPQERVGL